MITLVSLGEVVAFQHAGHGMTRGDFDEPGRLHLPEPARIEIDPGLLAIEDLEVLILVGLGICFDLSASQRRSRGIAPGWITDHPGEVANEERDLMTKRLELAHLVDEHRMTEVKIRSGRIEASLDPQGLSACEFLHELGFDEHLLGAAHQLADLILHFQVHHSLRTG